MAIRHRVPRGITGPFASRVDGEWVSHRSASGAWRRAWPPDAPGNLAVRVTSDGYGVPVAAPKDRPRGEGGTHQRPRRLLTADEAQFERWDAAASRSGAPWSKWAAEQLDLAASRKK